MRFQERFVNALLFKKAITKVQKLYLGYSAEKVSLLDADFSNSISVIEGLIGFFCDSNYILKREIEFWEDSGGLFVAVSDSKGKRWATFTMKYGEIDVRLSPDYSESVRITSEKIRGRISEFLWTLPDIK